VLGCRYTLLKAVSFVLSVVASFRCLSYHRPCSFRQAWERPSWEYCAFILGYAEDIFWYRYGDWTNNWWRIIFGKSCQTVDRLLFKMEISVQGKVTLSSKKVFFQQIVLFVSFFDLELYLNKNSLQRNSNIKVKILQCGGVCPIAMCCDAILSVVVSGI